MQLLVPPELAASGRRSLTSCSSPTSSIAELHLRSTGVSIIGEQMFCVRDPTVRICFVCTQCCRRQPGLAPLAQVGRHAVRRVADEDR